MYKHICAVCCVAFIAHTALAENSAKIARLSVKDAIEIGLSNRPEIKKSKMGIEFANGNYLREVSLPQPSLSVESEFIPNGQGISNYDERSVSISQDFEFPSIYFTRASRAGKTIDAAKSDLDIVSNKVRTAVKRAYFGAAEKRALLKVAEDNLAITEEFYKKAEIRVNVGEGSNLELLTSKVQLTEAKSGLISAQKEYKSALNELRLAMGYESNIDFDNIEFADSLGFSSQKFVYEELLNKSLQANPVIKKSNYELEASEINKNLAYMSLLPTFNASYAFQSRAVIADNRTSYSSDYHGFRLSLNFPLWFMFDQRGRIREADAEYLINTYEEQRVKSELSGKIYSAFEEYRNSVQQLDLYRDELIPQAEEIFRAADISYKAGEITYLEFLQAKLTTINTKINGIKIQFDYKESIVCLEEATGLTLE